MNLTIADRTPRPHWHAPAVHIRKEKLAADDVEALLTRLCMGPVVTPAQEGAFCVALSRAWQDWRSPLAFVKPATVIDWYRRGFRRYWR